ncbi:MAG: TerB family tellurite resistance protein [Mesonia hippocampi]|uniref:TerB family tellurite resistance protein n=1 Tax=Mesonia hippocampi TaxID=1628250 RepID=UPI003F9D37C7
MVKWIAAVVGLSYRGIFGAVVGFFIGSIIDAIISKGKAYKYTGFNIDTEDRVSPGDFELNLLTLSSIVIKADGSVSQRELDYVRNYFVGAYGKDKANATFRTFNEVIKKRQIDEQRICTYLAARTSYEVRLQILHFLFGIALTDGNVSNSELHVLQRIAGYLRINSADFSSIKAMFVKSEDNAYKILEIDKNASVAEIKKAYRNMAKKYHPDKLQHMDEAYRKGAQEKFTKVQEAYEQLQKQRGF